MVKGNNEEIDSKPLKLRRLAETVKTAMRRKKCMDIELVIGPEGDTRNIVAHKAVLGTASPVLANLMLNNDNPDQIRITDVSTRGFENLMRYLYDFNIKFTDLKTTCETYAVAERFKVPKLKQAIENCFHHAVNHQSALEMLKIALEFNLPKLKTKCIDAISTNYQNVLKSEEFFSAPFDVVETVLSVRPCNGEDCQYFALLAIGQWLKKHGTDQKFGLDLLKRVDIAQVKIMAFNEFIDIESGILPKADIRAFQKYILSNNILDAPKWYQSSNKCLGEVNKSEFQFSEQQKLNVEKVLEKELGYIETRIKEIINISLKNHTKHLNDAAEDINAHFSMLIKEAVETAVESFEDDMSFNGQKAIEKSVEEKNILSEVSCNKILPPINTDSKKSCKTLNMQQETTSLLLAMS